MDPQYGQRYRELFQNHWWWRAREELIVDTLRRYQPAHGWGKILDVGCGDGLFFERLSQFGDVEGIEPAGELVSTTTGIQQKRIYIAPFDEHFRPSNRYSLILMLDVLEHLPNPIGALQHALTLLTSAGTVLATVPAFKLLWTNHDVINHHLMRYTKSSFRDLARQAGLLLEMERYFFQWTCPVKLMVRVVEQLFGLRPKLPSVPPHWINQSLYFVSRLEQKTLGALPVPFGSSLLIIGRKPDR